jgi:cystathionine beta-lyase
MDLPNALSLTAAHAAYAEGEPWLDAVLDYLSGTFSWFEEELARRRPEIGLSRIEGTYLAWLDLRAIMSRTGATDNDVHRALLDTGALWLSDGMRFGTGGSGFQRMNLGCPRSVIADGLERLDRALDAL